MLINRSITTSLLLFLTAGLVNAQQFADVEKGVDRKPAALPTDPTLQKAKYLDKSLPIEERIDDLLSHMTPEEKAEVIHGASGYSYGKMPRIGMQEFGTFDGPQGMRLEGDRRSTAFPSGLAMAATWNPALIEKTGAVLGEECRGANGRVVLGPGVNIMRTPLGGRTFEYSGEDPLLAGKIAAAYIRGVQSKGTAASLKHWVLNDQEWARTVIDVDLGERALREIYARPFEIAVKESNPWTIMASYNRIRGLYPTNNLKLNNILYKEYQWDGALMSDWGGWHGDQPALNGGGTICMPSGKDDKRNKEIAQAVKDGKIDQKLFDEAVRRNLRMAFRVKAFDSEASGQMNTPEHKEIARKTAEESIVLLKNDQNILPLDKTKIKKIAVIGPNADQYHTMADGSKLGERGCAGATRGEFEITPLKAIVDTFGAENVLYAPGFRFEKPLVHSCPELKEMDPVEAAKQADVVIFVGGLDHSYDKECWGWGIVKGADKPDNNLKGEQDELIKKVIAANPKTIVTLVTGSPVLVEEWADKVPAILTTWYGGQDAGTALASVLTGAVNPSGKMPCTFGKKLTDWLSHSMGNYSYPGIVKTDAAGKTVGDPQQFYSDYIWVGYRHFDKAGIEPRFAFGHGLSYTTFKMEKTDSPEDSFSVKVTNTGKREGAEVVQCYISKPESEAPMPVRELVAFQKINLKPGQSETVTFKPQEEDLRYWNEENNGWKVAPGTYTLSIGNSSQNLPISYSFTK